MGNESALGRQEGGDHYRRLRIQPIEYIFANDLPFAEGCVVKYVTRWREKGGVQDLRKAIHFLELLIEEAERDRATVVELPLPPVSDGVVVDYFGSCQEVDNASS